MARDADPPSCAACGFYEAELVKPVAFFSFVRSSFVLRSFVLRASSGVVSARRVVVRFSLLSVLSRRPFGCVTAGPLNCTSDGPFFATAARAKAATGLSVHWVDP